MTVAYSALSHDAHFVPHFCCKSSLSKYRLESISLIVIANRFVKEMTTVHSVADNIFISHKASSTNVAVPGHNNCILYIV